jgi:nickel/cobalt transporter (NicO) family protein
VIQRFRSTLATAVALVAVLLLGLASAPPAQAHPLGNFSLNHHDALRISSTGVDDTAVVDSAEIPTAQDREKTDADGDGTVSEREAASRAEKRCAQLARASRVTIGGQRGTWRVRSSRLAYGKGTAGLLVSRLTCRLHTKADFSRTATVHFTSGADRARTGWKEITATGGRGVRVERSSVPARSVSAGLRRYPAEAADEPLNRTAASLRTRPGTGEAGGVTGGDVPGAAPGTVLGTSLFPGLQRELTGLTSGRDLTFPVGLLAVTLTVLLGAGHAALPGHAKLAVAACLARRRGGVRAALAVGATVTATHTTGVLVVGFALTLSGGLLGEQLLGWLGALSGALIAAFGAALVFTAVRALKTGESATWHHGHSHAHDQGHALGHHHGHDQAHDHVSQSAHGAEDPHPHHHPHTHEEGRERPSALGTPALLGVGLAGGLVPSPSALVVLLGATALSRTFFGVLLVVGYGLGMAATLTAAGLLLSGGGSRLTSAIERRLPRWSRYTRYGTLLTALAVLAVGLGLTLRSLQPL